MDPSLLRRPVPAAIPDAPGCYMFLDAQRRVIYVGKAKSLRKRLASYFGEPRLLHPRTAALIEAAADVEWIVTASEVESLHLEYTLIKANRPRFNVRYRDDKSYPFLAITVGEEVPRAMVTRGGGRPGVRRFGPYAHAYAIRETLDLLLRTFPVRTCSQGVFDRCRRAGRPCLLADIGKCAAPCVGRVSAAEHRGIVEDLIGFLEGRFTPVLDRLEKQMHAAAEALEFERAARLRDQLHSVRTAIERQVVVSGRDEDFDLVGIADDDLEAALQVFFVRGGRLAGRKGYVVDKVEALDRPDLLASFLRDVYMEADEIPREVLVPEEPADEAVLSAWLAGRRDGPVRFRVPQRGEKRALMETAAENAAAAFTQHKVRRRSDFDARARQLRALQEALGLAEAPLRIECYDISNLGADEMVGSMVVFEDALPRRSEYRRFRVRGIAGPDDVGAMREVLRRRFRRLLAERAGEPGSRRFAYPPNLIVVDGGRGQLGAATSVLAELELGEIAAVGLAKRFEEIHRPGDPAPLRIPRGSEALYLLQHLRDEAHRFALRYHRTLRRRRARTSLLDEIPGVGAERKRTLLRRFGSVGRILEAEEEDLAAVVPSPVARAIRAAGAGERPGRGDGGPGKGSGRRDRRDREGRERR